MGGNWKEGRGGEVIGWTSIEGVFEGWDGMIPYNDYKN